MPPAARPTDAELAILKELWLLRRATVRQIFDAMNATGSTVGYTTVLKLMQIMAQKGLVRRDETERTHVYSATLPEAKTLRQLTADLLRRAFDNSAEQLVLHALSAKRTSKDELRQIREMIERFEEEAE